MATAAYWCLARWRLLEGNNEAAIFALKRVVPFHWGKHRHASLLTHRTPSLSPSQCKSLVGSPAVEEEEEGVEAVGEGAMETTSPQSLVVYLCNCTNDQLITLGERRERENID